MHIIRCRLTLHDTVFYATREMGTLYETERYIHNYALSYAIFNNSLIKVPYFCASYKPDYPGDLGKLNGSGIYITPARPLHWDYILTTWKMGKVTYYRKPERFGGKNYPDNIGRSKELAPGSIFEFFVLSAESIELPRWIRLGKWMGKAEISVAWQGQLAAKSGPFVANHPLNPLDVPGQLTTFDLIAMPPVSLVANARLENEFFELPNKMRIPAGMRYTFPKAA